MSLDRFLDPVTEDFVDDEGGAFFTDDVVLNKLAMSYKIPRGSWEGDPDLGHGFDELSRATDTAQNRLRLKNLAEAAAQWLIDSGELAKVVVTVEQFQPGAVAFEVDAYKPGQKNPITAGPFAVPVGAA